MLSINELTYTYPQNESGIGPYSLSVRPGEVLHVTGSSGCGKSTLARCAAGLIPHLYHGAISGEVLVGGRPAAATPLWELAETAGFVFQNPAAQMLGNLGRGGDPPRPGEPGPGAGRDARTAR